MKKVHISWQLTGASIGFLIGVALSLYDWSAFAASSLWALAAGCLLLVSFSRRSRRFVVLAASAGLAIGLWRGASEQQALLHYRTYLNKTVTVQGTVSEDVSIGERGDTRLQLTHISLNNRPMHGKVWLSATTKQTIKRNDTLVLHGKLKEGFGNIPASMTNAQLIAYQPTNQSDSALQLRDWFAGGVRRAIPEPQASLGSGFLVGQHSSLPGELSDQLQVVGLTHAVVASGSNLTILVGFMRRLFLRVSKYTATLAGALMTTGFIMITGLSPSMTRAGLVTALSLAAWYYGRGIHPLVLLPIAAAITAIVTPAYVWGDIGWCLSFGAFAGVLILAPLVQHYFWGKDYTPNIMMEIFIGTISAQLATLPIILYSFGNLSPYALVANMLVLPLVPLAMLLTFLAGLAGVTFGSIAHTAGLPATWVMQYMTSVIDHVARLPGARGMVALSALGICISYGGLTAVCLYMWRKTAHRFGNETNKLIGESS